MRVNPRSLPRSAGSASFAKLFPSIVVAAFVAQGCTDPVTDKPDAASDATAPDAAAPDAGPPFGNACPTDQGGYSPSLQIDDLRRAAGLDYLEMRTINIVNGWDGGLNPNAMWMTAATAGVRCATASSASACASAYAAIGNDPSFPNTLFVYTRGDEVGAVRSLDDFARLYAPIGAVTAAAFIAVYRASPILVSCVGSARPIASGGWEILGTTYNCWVEADGQPRRITRVLVRVAPDGTSTTTPLDTTVDGTCPVS